MKFPIIATKYIGHIAAFYGKHQSVILTGATIGSSLLTTGFTFKNAPAIIDIISDAKAMILDAKTEEEKHQIYKLTLKELAPKVLPILAFQTATVTFALMAKRESDKKLAAATQSLALANNAIMAYQAFQKEAEEKLGHEAIQQIKQETGKKIIAADPKTEKNDISALPDGTDSAANEVYQYYDRFGQRYFKSTISPSLLKQKIQNLSIRLNKGEINNYDENGRARVTYNDIYRIIDERLIMRPAGDQWGFYDDERGQIDESTIDVDITPIEDPSNPDNSVWMFDLCGETFLPFRKRW